MSSKRWHLNNTKMPRPGHTPRRRGTPSDSAAPSGGPRGSVVPRPHAPKGGREPPPKSEKHGDNFGGRELKVSDTKDLRNAFCVSVAGTEAKSPGTGPT